MREKVFESLPSLGKFHKVFLRIRAMESVLFGFLSLLSLVLIFVFLVQVKGFEALHRWLLIIAAVAGSASIYRVWRLFKKKTTFSELCSHLEGISPRFKNLKSAVEFSSKSVREGISEEMAQAVIDSTEKTLMNEQPESYFSRKGVFHQARQLGIVLLICFCSAAFPPHLFQSGLSRLIHGNDQELARHLKISPEGGRVLMGQPVTINVELIKPSSEHPRVLVLGGSGWEESPPSGGPFKFSFLIASIIETTSFKVQWGRLESRVYELIPLEPPRLGDFKITLRSPSYTGESAKSITGEPHIHGLRGTQAVITARANRKLKKIEMVSSQGSLFPVQVSRGRDVSASFSVQNPFEFWFDLEDEDGIKPIDPVRYQVTVREDAPPEIELFSPSDDLIAGQESKIPFTFSIRDDLGIQSLFLHAETSAAGRSRKIPLKRYDPPVQQKTDEFSFDLSDLKPVSGETLRLRLEVQDNDTVTGPKSGFSNWITVEIRSYEREHEAIAKELEKFREDLIELLSEQSLASVSESEWNGLSKDPAALSSKLEKTQKAQSEASRHAQEIEKNLKQILEKMERDPLSDYSIYSEHEALLEALKSAREGPMSGAEEALQSKMFEKSSQAQEEAVSQIERLTHLSEEVQKYGNMKDLMHSADRLSEKGERLAERLAGEGPMNEETRKEVESTLREAFQILAEIQKSIQDLPKDLPEDFVNKPAVKNVDLHEMSNSIQDLSEALRSGDKQSALRAAQKLLKEAKAAREAISKAAEESASMSEDDLAKKSGENEGRIGEIASRQEGLLSKTHPFESKRKAKQLEEQMKVLEQLARIQKEAIQNTESLSLDLSNKNPQAPYQQALRQCAGEALPKMKKVHVELEGRNILFSQKWLEEIIQVFSPGIAAQERHFSENRSTSAPESVLLEAKESGAFGDRARGVVAAEKNILDKLRNPPQPSSPFSQEEMEKMKSIAKDQDELAGETEKLASEISEMGRKSAKITPEVMQSVKGARDEMRSAKKSLSEGESERAVAAQERALAHLRRGQEGMPEGSESGGSGGSGFSKGRPGGRGQGMAGSVQPRGQSGGSSGMRHGVVKIPGAKDYLPPREFREEILESLKEKYPKSQEGVIKDYFKRLTQ